MGTKLIRYSLIISPHHSLVTIPLNNLRFTQMVMMTGGISLKLVNLFYMTQTPF